MKTSGEEDEGRICGSVEDLSPVEATPVEGAFYGFERGEREKKTSGARRRLADVFCTSAGILFSKSSTSGRISVHTSFVFLLFFPLFSPFLTLDVSLDPPHLHPRRTLHHVRLLPHSQHPPDRFLSGGRIGSVARFDTRFERVEQGAEQHHHAREE